MTVTLARVATGDVTKQPKAAPKPAAKAAPAKDSNVVGQKDKQPKDANKASKGGGSGFDPSKHPRGAGGMFAPDSGSGSAKEGTGDKGAGTGATDGKAHGRIGAAQAWLVKNGFLDKGAGRQGKGVDGLFGPKTKAAVTAYQKKIGLKATGEIDAETAKAMKDNVTEKPKVVPAKKGAVPAKKGAVAPAKSGVAPPVPAKKVPALKTAKQQIGTGMTMHGRRKTALQQIGVHRMRSTEPIVVEEPTDDSPAKAEWSGPIGLEGIATGDGRLILTNALHWDTLPIPLRWAQADYGEHDGAVVVGKITKIERNADNQIIGTGEFDLGSPHGKEAYRHVKEGLTPGVSMDLDDIVVREDAMDKDSFTITEGRVRAATLVAIPAFEGARIAVSDPLTFAEATLNWVEDVGGLPDYIKRIKKHLEDNGMDESHAVATAVNVCKKMCATGDTNFPGAQQVNAGSRAEACAAVADWEAKKVQAKASAGDTLTASAAVFDHTWFEDPHLSGPTPLTVTEDGRVFGHIALWGTCHIASPQGAGVCTQPPNSMSNYAYFKTGAVSTTKGDVAVGRITLNTVHAGPRLSSTDTMRHYEHTGTVGAFVNAGEDESGIWIAGGAKPGADYTTLKGAPISGDWRQIGGHLEMVGALAVNVPGFPIPRAEALVAGGAVLSLVASGVVSVDNTITGRLKRRRAAESLARRVDNSIKYLRVREVALSLRTGYNSSMNTFAGGGKDQWRVPKGSGPESGRFVDMPDLAIKNLEINMQDAFESASVDDSQAAEIGKTFDKVLAAGERTSDALRKNDGPGASKAALEADTELSKLEAQLQDVADVAMPDTAANLGESLAAARDSIDTVKNADLSLLGDKGLETPGGAIDITDKGVVGDKPKSDAPKANDLSGLSDEELGKQADSAKTITDVKAAADEYKRRRQIVEKTGKPYEPTAPKAGPAQSADTAVPAATRTDVPTNMPAGWSADDRAPFPTFYNKEGTVGITKDEDGSGQWFPIGYDPNTEEVKPMNPDGSLMDWSERPEMFDNPNDALKSAEDASGAIDTGGEPSVLKDGANTPNVDALVAIDPKDRTAQKQALDDLSAGSVVELDDTEFVTTIQKNEDGTWKVLSSSLADMEDPTMEPLTSDDIMGEDLGPEYPLKFTKGDPKAEPQWTDLYAEDAAPSTATKYPPEADGTVGPKWMTYPNGGAQPKVDDKVTTADGKAGIIVGRGEDDKGHPDPGSVKVRLDDGTEVNVLAKDVTPSDGSQKAPESTPVAPAAPAPSPDASPSGSTQQKAAVKVDATASLLEQHLTDAADTGAIETSDAEVIGGQLNDVRDSIDALKSGIDDGNYNADDLSKLQTNLSNFESTLMGIADKPGLSDDQAAQMGQVLDDLFAQVGDLAAALQGETAPPPFANRKYGRQWLGRRGIRLGGSSLI